MSTDKSDNRRREKIIRYKAPDANAPEAVANDPLYDTLNFVGMIASMCGLMFKFKLAAWAAVYCSFICFGNSRAADDTKQLLSSFMLSISAVVMSYLQNPTPLAPPFSSLFAPVPV